MSIEAKRARNRAEFPEAAKVMDALAMFSPRLVWAEENGKVIWRKDGQTK